MAQDYYVTCTIARKQYWLYGSFSKTAWSAKRSEARAYSEDMAIDLVRKYRRKNARCEEIETQTGVR